MAGAALVETMLPGITDEITLVNIATKLSWSGLRALYSTSRKWQRAFASREVHRERVRCDATETIVAIKHVDERFPNSPKFAISLYYMRERRFRQLPPLPHGRRVSRYSSLISVDGRLYVLGADSKCECRICSGQALGRGNPLDCIAYSVNSTVVYMLDLAAEAQWQQVRAVPGEVPPRPCQCVGANDMYCSFNLGPHVPGHVFKAGCKHWFSSHWLICLSEMVETREFRVVPPLFVRDCDIGRARHFSFEGRLYRITQFVDLARIHTKFFHIDVQNAYTQAWVPKHLTSYDRNFDGSARRVGTSPVPGPDSSLRILFIIPVNDELLALSSWDTQNFFGFFLFQSRGFGTERFEIEWERAPYTFNFDAETPHAICPIQL